MQEEHNFPSLKQNCVSKYVCENSLKSIIHHLFCCYHLTVRILKVALCLIAFTPKVSKTVEWIYYRSRRLNKKLSKNLLSEAFKTDGQSKPSGINKELASYATLYNSKLKNNSEQKFKYNLNLILPLFSPHTKQLYKLFFSLFGFCVQ